MSACLSVNQLVNQSVSGIIRQLVNQSKFIVQENLSFFKHQQFIVHILRYNISKNVQNVDLYKDLVNNGLQLLYTLSFYTMYVFLLIIYFTQSYG